MFPVTQLINIVLILFIQTDLEKFWADFIHHAKYSMVIYNREPVVERTIEFLAKFATSLLVKDEDAEKAAKQKEDASDEETEEEMHPFLLKFFTFCLEVLYSRIYKIQIFLYN